jgi:hypothetical protein
MLIPKKNRREVYKYLFKGECSSNTTAAALRFVRTPSSAFLFYSTLAPFKPTTG